MVFFFTALHVQASGHLAAKPQDLYVSDAGTTVYGTPPADLSGLTEGPEIEGFIAARNSDG